MRICEPNASDSFHWGILSHIYPLLLREPPLSSPQMTFHCQPPFLSFHISSQCFFFFVFHHSCSHIPASLLAKAWLVQLWFLVIPLHLEQTWTVPRWARTQLAGSVRGWLWSMDGWMAGHGLLACTLIFFCWWHTLVLLSLSLCGLTLTTVVFFCSLFPMLVLLFHWKYLPLPVSLTRLLIP